MKSHLKSEGKYFPVRRFSCSLVSLLALFGVLGCQTGNRSSSKPSDLIKHSQQLNDEVSLKSDRSELEALRGDIPQATQMQNDELAMDLELMAKAKQPPHEIRAQFQQKVRKLRTQFRDKTQKVRAQFRDSQAREREEFLNETQRERDDFKSNKPDREKSKEFYAAQDLKRRDFYENQKAQRREFEAQLEQKNKDVNGNMKTRIDQFEEQLRLYSKRRAEEEKLAKATKASMSGKETKGEFSSDPNLDAEAAKILREFDEMKSAPSEKLEP
jgi:hypothetical protein